ncbi:hypothetical protein ACJQWK_06349 [Exserohilum turcicum]
MSHTVSIVITLVQGQPFPCCCALLIPNPELIATQHCLFDLLSVPLPTADIVSLFFFFPDLLFFFFFILVTAFPFLLSFSLHKLYIHFVLSHSHTHIGLGAPLPMLRGDISRYYSVREQRQKKGEMQGPSLMVLRRCQRPAAARCVSCDHSDT